MRQYRELGIYKRFGQFRGGDIHPSSHRSRLSVSKILLLSNGQQNWERYEQGG